MKNIIFIKFILISLVTFSQDVIEENRDRNLSKYIYTGFDISYISEPNINKVLSQNSFNTINELGGNVFLGYRYIYKKASFGFELGFGNTMSKSSTELRNYSVKFGVGYKLYESDKNSYFITPYYSYQIYRFQVSNGLSSLNSVVLNDLTGIGDGILIFDNYSHKIGGEIGSINFLDGKSELIFGYNYDITRGFWKSQNIDLSNFDRENFSTFYIRVVFNLTKMF